MVPVLAISHFSKLTVLLFPASGREMLPESFVLLRTFSEGIHPEHWGRCFPEGEGWSVPGNRILGAGFPKNGLEQDSPATGKLVRYRALGSGVASRHPNVFPTAGGDTRLKLTATTRLLIASASQFGGDPAFTFSHGLLPLAHEDIGDGH
jgi:hypothetical protein